EPDESGRRRPIPLEGSEFVLEADTVILAVGQRGDFSFLTGEEPLRLTDRGTLEVDEITLATGMPGVFAGGDAVLGPSSVVEAVAQGHEAAISIDRYLSGQDLKAGRVKPAPVPAEAPPGKLTPQAREPMPQVPPDQRIRGFEEVERGFSRAQALAEAQRCLHCGICAECMQCVQVCQPQAIDHTQQEEVFTLSVGAVILALGVEGFRPELRGEYGYGQCANVVTSLEFERLLSPSGPFQGEVRRPSDGQPPQRIAWIQCVGSRDVQCGNPYCSSVCCMYATKQAIIAKEHQADLQATVFFNDLRAFGKGFERYYERAKEEYGVRYLKSLVSTVKELQQSQNLLLQYVLDDGKVHEEEFDLVVLSVGLTPTAEAQELARRLGVELNAYGFVQTSKFRPNETSRPGIFVCGAFERPMDIPETVMTASSAAAWAAELLAAGRGQWVREKTYPPERDLQGEEPRVGVFVCHCGTNIARVVKVEEVVEYARTLDSVAHAEHNLYTCSTDAQRQIVETIQEKGLNRVVVASCTPRTHEPLFQDMLREAGLNPYLLEMANIRDQCSWVHADWPRQATAKAKDLVRMAVARARRLEPLPERLLPVQPRGLVLGGGVAGMTAALSLARQGFETYLVEREAELGGRLRDLRETLEGEDPQQHLHWLRQQVEDEPRLTVYTEAQVKDFSGHLGHFRTRIQSKGQEVELEHGILILATGGVEYRPKEYLYGQDERVLTQLELEKRLSQGRQEFTQSREVVMIQCVGSRDEEHPYCSRICCSEAVKNALALKRLHPETNVYVLYRDLRTYGFQEEDYRRAREAGVLFIRYDPQTKPTVRQRNGKLEVEVYDSVLGTPVRMQPDYLVLSSAIRPHPAGLALAERFKIPVDSDGFFLEAHLKLRPLDFANEGMYLCGLAHAPKFLHETIAQARGAAARAATILAREYLPVSSIVATVEEEKCAACLTCVRLCPFEVPRLREEVAWIDPAVCQGCGICASACPARAIQIGHYRDEQILAMCEDLYG
ncbi:MAG TPA: FAD-dependent oxidoreductase, partial [Armatimonadetes bacterium]|nr:FAD-dependent oxidoreductase [Armatimonadota bacterium]